MQPQFVRPYSSLEALFADFQDAGENMAFRFYLLLDQAPELPFLEQTLQTTLQTYPHVNLRLQKNGWYRADYVPPCQILEVEEEVCTAAPGWVDFRTHTLAMTVLRTPSQKWYLCFDFFHGAVDGRSALQFLYAFFAVADGLTPDASDGTLSYTALLPGKKTKRRPFHIPWKPIIRPNGWKPRVKGSYKTVSVTGAACPRGASERLSRIVGRFFCGKRATTVIPIDLRPHGVKPEAFLLGNLILPALTDPFRYPEGQLQSALRADARDPSLHAGIGDAIAFYARLPRWLTRLGLRMTMPVFRRIPRFICASVISPVGTVEHDRLQCSRFAVQDMKAAFTATPLNAFTVVSLQFNGHSSTTVSWHSGRVPDAVAQELAQALSKEPVKTA